MLSSQHRPRPQRRHGAGRCAPPCPARAVPPSALTAPLSAEAVAELSRAEADAYADYVAAYAVWRQGRLIDPRRQHTVSVAYRAWRSAQQALTAGQTAAPALFTPFTTPFNSH